jgi:hypothetical protein
MLLALSAIPALGTTIPAGSGTLSFTVTTYTYQCVNHLDQVTTYTYNVFTNFSYTLSGKTTPLGGMDADYFVDGIGGNTCPTPTDPPISWTVSPDVITFTPVDATGIAKVTPE